MSSEPVRVGFIGAGGFARTMGSAATQTDRVEIVKLWDPVTESAERFAKDFGGTRVESRDEILEDGSIEAIVAPVPNPVHEEVVLSAAAAGKPVLVEKPLSNDVAAGRRMIAACREAGVLLAVGHNNRRGSGMRKVGELVRSGALGRILMFEGHSTHPGGRRLTPELWRWHKDKCPGGPLMQLGVHLIDTLLHLLGPCESVCAMMDSLFIDAEIEDTTAVLMRMESGVIGYIGDNYATPHVHHFRVMGTDGVAFTDRGRGGITVRWGGDSGKEGEETFALENRQGKVEELENFAAAIRGEAEYEIPGEVGLQTVAVVEAAIRSAAERRQVTIAEVLGEA